MIKTKLAKGLNIFQRQSKHSNLVDESLAWETQHKDNHLLLLGELNYPSQLLELTAPPPLLFAKGDLSLLNNSALAIVGSRRPSPYGVNQAHSFARHLSELGITVVSGLALGVDGAAHEGALDAKGSTIAILGSGLNQPYPAEHQTLFETIAQKGLLISQFPLNYPPKAHHFPIRNELISALSKGTFVIEAALKSGSLITARLAANQGKEVFALPGSILNPMSRGCHHLIKDGAKLTETVADILEELSLSVPKLNDKKTHKNKKILENHLQNLVEFVGYEATTVDYLLEKTGLSIEKLLQNLLELELKGHIKAVSGGFMRLY